MTSETKPLLVLDTPKGPVEVISTDGQNVTLQADFPSPPGSPLRGVLREAGFTLQVKIHGCRRVTVSTSSAPSNEPRPADRFEFHGRWVSLSKEARLAVLGGNGT